MNFEKQQIIEREGKNRERLLLLEKEGKYVFHGSPDLISVLKPRQAYNHNSESGNMEKDGQPAVFASPYVDVAIFRALTNANDVNGDSISEFGLKGEALYFSATENILESAKSKVGKVYVLDKQKFQDFEGVQCRSTEIIQPIEIVEVTFNDLPKNIKVID